MKHWNNLFKVSDPLRVSSFLFFKESKAYISKPIWEVMIKFCVPGKILYFNNWLQPNKKQECYRTKGKDELSPSEGNSKGHMPKKQSWNPVEYQFNSDPVGYST